MTAIRHATPADASAIAAFWNPWIRDTAVTFSPETRAPEDLAALIAERAARGWPWLVAEGAEGLLGFAAYAQFRGGPGYAHTMEHTIILAPAARGQGVGRALMAALAAEARARGVHVLVGCVSGENADGMAFHRAFGFREAGVIRGAGRKFDRWMDLAIFELVL